jgi:hypothetical protein
MRSARVRGRDHVIAGPVPGATRASASGWCVSRREKQTVGGASRSVSEVAVARWERAAWHEGVTGSTSSRRKAAPGVAGARGYCVLVESRCAWRGGADNAAVTRAYGSQRTRGSRWSAVIERVRLGPHTRVAVAGAERAGWDEGVTESTYRGARRSRARGRTDRSGQDESRPACRSGAARAMAEGRLGQARCCWRQSRLSRSALDAFGDPFLVVRPDSERLSRGGEGRHRQIAERLVRAAVLPCRRLHCGRKLRFNVALARGTACRGW